MRSRARWGLAARPELTLDGRHPSRDELGARIAAFWLPDEVVLYVGKATGLSSRLRQYYTTRLGARTPHAGGYFLKTLSNLDELAVFYATCSEPLVPEDAMLAAFCSAVSTSTLDGLHDPEHPFPFANLEWPAGTRKRHGLKGAKAERRAAGPKAPADSARDSVDARSAPRRESGLVGSGSPQRVTEADLGAGRIRIPRSSKHLFPSARGEIDVELRGVRRRCRYDPRLGPDQERSGVLLVGKEFLAGAVTANEVLSVEQADEFVRLE